MDKLLSDKWDNSFLNEMVHDALMYCRRETVKPSEEQFQQTEYMRSTFLVLVDHPQMKKFNTDVVVVADNRNSISRDLVFVLKDGLVNNLDKQHLPEKEDTALKVIEYISEVGKNAMGNKYAKVSLEDFTALLKHANLQNVIDVLELEKKSSKQHTI